MCAGLRELSGANGVHRVHGREHVPKCEGAAISVQKLRALRKREVEIVRLHHDRQHGVRKLPGGVFPGPRRP